MLELARSNSLGSNWTKPCSSSAELTAEIQCTLVARFQLQRFVHLLCRLPLAAKVEQQVCQAQLRFDAGGIESKRFLIFPRGLVELTLLRQVACQTVMRLPIRWTEANRFAQCRQSLGAPFHFPQHFPEVQ